MSDLLFEILSEEIPARMQARAIADLQALICDGFAGAGLDIGAVRAFITPRRMALVISDVADATPDLMENRKGPRVDSPEEAINGFLKSVGLTRDQLKERDLKKGRFFIAPIEKPGRCARDVVREVLEVALPKLPWPTSMRWADHPQRWVRPMTSMLCVLGREVVAVRFGPLTAGNLTRGHRFLAPQDIEITDAPAYGDLLLKAGVMVDRDARKQVILQKSRALAKAAGLVLNEDAGLLEEVTGLVEWPVPVMGAIDAHFMDVPPEVLITSMKAHQKYFTLSTKDGRLAPRFITISNMVCEDGGAAIVAGNERVLRARLYDAKFFWENDRKTRLADRVPGLRKIVFHARLGTVHERVLRLQKLARTLAADIPDCDGKLADRAAEICKADLTTGMVSEFPELQGVIGRYYASHDGEAAAVADAVARHYQPAGPDDDCPRAPVAVALALAEKLDTLAGFFSIDEKPTGSKDPFALRRAALGVIRLILENELRLPLRRIFAAAIDHYPAAIARPAAVEELFGFFADRLAVYLKAKGVRHDLISAVFAPGTEDDLPRLLARIDALAGFLASDDGSVLMAGYKRAANILKIEQKKDKTVYDGAVSAGLLSEPAERVLSGHLADVRQKALSAVAKEDFSAAMAQCARLRAPVDAFFDTVTVNVGTPALRANRLRLLGQIRHTMDAVADFSKIEG